VTIANFKELSDNIKRNPASLIFGEAPEEINFEEKK
jgi:hypothetical protein